VEHRFKSRMAIFCIIRISIASFLPRFTPFYISNAVGQPWVAPPVISRRETIPFGTASFNVKRQLLLYNR